MTSVLEVKIQGLIAQVKHTHKHRDSQVLRRVVAQAATSILKHHVCAIHVEQLVGIHGHKDAAYVGLCGKKREIKD